jgi:hypothetical protein
MSACYEFSSSAPGRWVTLSNGSFSPIERSQKKNLREAVAMETDWVRRENEIAALRETLKQDPTNLEVADRYWNAVGFGKSGGVVRDAYREAAVASGAGAAAFARAYRELCLSSGEGPRSGHFDDGLIQALQTYLPELTGENHSNVEWVLQSLADGRFEVGTTKNALLEKLVVWQHLNVFERKMLASDSISVAEVAALIKRLLERCGTFPPTARTWTPGEAVFEGYFLVKHSDGKIELMSQRGNPIKPNELADQECWTFASLDQAISKFIESEWPKGIDGISFSHATQD